MINKLKSELVGSESNPMSHAYCVAPQFGGKSTHTFREGSSPGRVMGAGGGECHA